MDECDRRAVDRAIEVLNRVHAADPSVLPALIAHRVPCNKAIGDDPTVQVGRTAGTEDKWEVGLLGIVNGLFGVRGERAVGFIAAHYDDAHRLLHFEFNARCSSCERCRWPGGGCGQPAHPLCLRCGHCRFRHADQSDPGLFALADPHPAAHALPTERAGAPRDRLRRLRPPGGGSRPV